MNDKMYHEYTVAFPQPGTMPEDYYIYRPLEKSRVLCSSNSRASRRSKSS